MKSLNNLIQLGIFNLLETFIQKCNYMEKYHHSKNKSSRGLGKVGKVACTSWEEMVFMVVQIFFICHEASGGVYKFTQKMTCLSPPHTVVVN
jgi:hypothetical protein